MTHPQPPVFRSAADSDAMEELLHACAQLAEEATAAAAGDAVTLADYTLMRRSRRMEEELHALKVAGQIAPNIHNSIGQEAVSAGGVATLARHDILTSTYRGRAHALAKGAPLAGIVAEVLGRETGLSRGRTGPMHMIHPESNLLFESAIVGAAAPIAVGAALSAERLGTGAVAMTIFGDGATAQGVVHEALNLAGVMRLPIIFVLENNGYSEMTPTALTTALRDLSWRALGHGVPALHADGNDVVSMRAATRAALSWARARRGPVLIEASTYRLTGHYSTEQAKYRPDGEWEQRLAADPLAAARAQLVASAGAADLDAVDAAVEQEVADAIAAALAAPSPDPATRTEHVYAEER
ncbi:thiamine pyrophosphate-dependent dehydrogenase E1 component subunit alpha [Microbacterium sp. RD1]|uniref:thiamine pyrophosphate-dependent dehydrogenase E1 component subunit alpha n=1 Tax=Microbacterium sp. RD1 TaxID=3457313 RepID=UPI003FA5F462